MKTLSIFLISLFFLASCNDNKVELENSNLPPEQDSIHHRIQQKNDNIYKNGFINSICPNLIPINSIDSFLFGYVNASKRENSWGILIFKGNNSDSLNCYYHESTTYTHQDFRMELEETLFYGNNNLYTIVISERKFQDLVISTGLSTYESPIIEDPANYYLSHEALYTEAHYNDHYIQKIEENKPIMDKLESYLLDSIINPLFK